MDKELSQDEINKLLSKIFEKENADIRMNKNGLPRIKIYDFKRPDIISKKKIDVFYAVHATMSRNASIDIAKIFSVNLSMGVATIDQLTFEEYLRSIPKECYSAEISGQKLKQHAVFEIDPIIINKLSKEKNEKTSMQLPDETKNKISEDSVKELFQIIIKNFCDAWESYDLYKYSLKIDKIHRKTNTMQIIPMNDWVLLISIIITINEIEGFLNICLPYYFIENLLLKEIDSNIFNFNKKADNTNRKIKQYLKNRKINRFIELYALLKSMKISKIYKKKKFKVDLHAHYGREVFYN